MEKIKKILPIIKDWGAWVIALFAGLYSYINTFSMHVEDKAETSRCLIKIAREETDVNKKYFKRTKKEIRSTNDYKGHYWFDNEKIIEVEYSQEVDDFYYYDGNAKQYLESL